ncbi:hypothetical protein A1O1_01944 [Capronia coronata CBS 617.96]|uniref:FAD dependent oxidoreductase domain-containing protein n=1 Tax=Capronia coronata CBS 617.96 TaxID=1182541 RepID=W9YKW5_9EURO|nr:uncharacterized protein A1O1_01944 [Capronia coronata CBS 617.96]EXJ93552.1 hypothetical protein A1O1_01944 [Capronia coronata CBS 617.96]
MQDSCCRVSKSLTTPSILYPLSSILYPLSSILYPLSSILYPPYPITYQTPTPTQPLHDPYVQLPNYTLIDSSAGIIGLTTALTLQEQSPNSSSITIIAAHFPGDESINYTSPWAGAHGRVSPALTAHDRQLAQYMQTTYDVLQAQSAGHPETGVLFMDGYEYLAHPSESYTQLRDGIGSAPGFRVLTASKLPPGIKWGCTYRTWSLNPPVYCAFLLRRFILRGGKTRRVRLQSLAEVVPNIAPQADLVVNCSGVGFGDKDVFPIKGQTCLVSNPCDRTITQQNVDGTWTFIIPRPLEGGTVIGGTKVPHDWSITASMETRRELLSKAAAMYPAILEDSKDGKSSKAKPKGEFHVIRDIVGRRPARIGGFRLSVEELQSGSASSSSSSSSSGSRPVKLIHAYGAGGSGYELSWGVAREVAKLAFGERGLSRPHHQQQLKAAL